MSVILASSVDTRMVELDVLCGMTVAVVLDVRHQGIQCGRSGHVLSVMY